MMSSRKFEFGDRVRHARKPEWGIGSIVKAEEMTLNDRRAQRVSVRFPNAGLKTISTAHAELQLVNANNGPETDGADTHPLGGWDKMKESDWLGEVAQRKVLEAMTSIAPEALDPFMSSEKRLEACLDLYRFERTGRSVIDWAVAQSGLADPLSRFTRHELEVLFDQWAAQRDEQMGRLLQEVKVDPGVVAKLVDSAPPRARDAVRRLTAAR
ncbi:MAG: DUF3553 domain-containing protein [Planctomycetota bacterium]|jgi:hypothetical protein